MLLLGVAVIVATSIGNGQITFKSPQPGEVYKEFVRFNNNFSNEWRVTDPNISLSAFPQAAAFLPNPTLYMNIDDLTDAIRAEAVLTTWAGHIGTTGKTIAFNGNSPIALPELGAANGIPAGHNGQCYISEPMIGIDVPLGHLRTGQNSFQAGSGGQTCYSYGWGQWGLYAVIIRVYYDPARKAHPTGTITSPTQGGALSENPTITAP